MVTAAEHSLAQAKDDRNIFESASQLFNQQQYQSALDTLSKLSTDSVYQQKSAALQANVLAATQQLNADEDQDKPETQITDKINEALAKAKEYSNKADWQNAIREYQQALSLDSAHEEASRGVNENTSWWLQSIEQDIVNGRLSSATTQLTNIERQVGTSQRMETLEEMLRQATLTEQQKQSDLAKQQQEAEQKRLAEQRKQAEIAEQKRIEEQRKQAEIAEQKRRDEEAAPKLSTVEAIREADSRFQQLAKAVMNRNERALGLLTEGDEEKLDLMKAIFNKYQQIEVEISNLERTTDKNEVSAVLSFQSLSLPDGTTTIPASSWRYHSIKLEYEQDGWSKIRW